MTTIAGHRFHDTATGRQCEGCGMKWADLMSARRDDIGCLHVAHTGALTEREYAEIEAERDRVWACGP